MAGRRPKPLAMHQLNGNPRHFSQADLKGDDNPQPQAGTPEMPKGLTKSARREWKKIVPLLLGLGVLSEIDGKALAAYCDAFSMAEDAQKEIVKHGLTFVTHFETKDGQIVEGDIKANPAVAIKFNAMKVMKSFLIEFGLTPASRTKLKIQKKDDGDLMEKFMKGRPSSGPLIFSPAAIDPSEMTAGDDEPAKD